MSGNDLPQYRRLLAASGFGPRWPSVSTGLRRAGVRPSLFDIIFIIWAVVVPVGFGYRLLNSDGDLARHLRLGEMMLDQPRPAPARTCSPSPAPGQPFVAFE